MADSSVTVPQQAKELDTQTVTTDVGVVHRQVVVLGDPSSANEMLQIADGKVPVSVGGTVAVSAAALPLPTGAATNVLQTAGNATLADIKADTDSIKDRLPATPATTKTIGTQITTADVGAVSNAVIHGLSTGGGGGYVDVKVTPSGALVADTGLSQPLTDTQLRATAVPISGTVTANTGLTQPLTDTQLRASSVLTRDYGIDVSRGLVSGVTFQTLQGYNQATSTTNEPIWAQSGTTYPNVTTAQTLTLSSSSALDTSAGTGARTVLVTYVRFSDSVEVSTTITLNGQTAVTITTDGYAVNGMRVLTAGTGGSNAGTLYVGYGAVTLGVPANVLGTVVIGKNKAQQVIYTVPSGKAFELMAFRIITSVLTFIQLRSRSAPTSVDVVEFDLPLNGTAAFNSIAPSVFAAGTQIQLWAQTAAGAGVAGVILSGYLRSV